MSIALAEPRRKQARANASPAPQEVATERPSLVLEFAARTIALAVYVTCGMLWLRAATGDGGGMLAWVMFAVALAAVAVCLWRLFDLIMGWRAPG